jgi:hypothetical protein
MLEAIVTIIALGGLEIATWYADHKRQAERLATLDAIWVEWALLNEEKVSMNSSARAVDLPVSLAQTPTVVS